MTLRVKPAIDSMLAISSRNIGLASEPLGGTSQTQARWGGRSPRLRSIRTHFSRLGANILLMWLLEG